MKDVDFLNMEKSNSVMDRGFYSESNINELFRKNHKFLIGTRTSLKLVRHKLDEIRDSFVSRSNYNLENQLYIKSFSTEWNYTATQLRTDELNIIEFYQQPGHQHQLGENYE